ncbi:putative ninein-like, partial [Homarus americanus]
MGLLAPVKRRGSNSGSGDDSCEEESPRGTYDESFFDSSMSSLLKSSPAPSTQPLNSSQPTSLDELAIKVPRRSSSDSDAGETNAIKETFGMGIKSASQLVNKELKQVFKQVRASVKEEYKNDLGEDSDSQRQDERVKNKSDGGSEQLDTPRTKKSRE